MRMGVEKYIGMSVPLRTGFEKYSISYMQIAWERGNNEVQFCLGAWESRITLVCLSRCARDSRNTTFSRLELQLRVLFVVFGPLVLTTSKILKGGSGFPELQIPRFQKRRFRLQLLPVIFGISSHFFFATPF